MSDAQVTLTVAGPATVKVTHRDTRRRETAEQEQGEQQRASWWPKTVSEDGTWESWL